MSARKILPGAEYIVIDPKEKDLFHPCGLPYSLEGIVPQEGLNQNINLDGMKVKKIRARALKVLPEEKVVITDDTAGNEKISYDRLIITTGAVPFVPPVQGARELLGRGLHTLTSMEDLDSLRRSISGKNSGIVIGAGAIGLESAIALRHHMKR